MKRVRKTLELPAELIEEITKFQKENYMTTFTGALIELVRRGLENTEGK